MKVSCVQREISVLMEATGTSSLDTKDFPKGAVCSRVPRQKTANK